MKATATQYAKTLYELTKDKKHQEIDGIVSNFLKELNKNGQLKIVRDVVRKFEEIYNQENGIIEAEVISREELSKGMTEKFCQFIGKKYDAKNVVICNTIDEDLKGGVIIRVGDEILDGSLDRKLAELKKELVK